MNSRPQDENGRTAPGTAPAAHSFSVLPDALAKMFGTFSHAVADYEGLLETMAREIGTATGDACNLRLLSADGRSLRAIVPRDMDAILRDATVAAVTATADISAWGPWRAVIQERRLLRFSRAALPEDLSPPQLEFVREFDVRHAMLAPLVARGRVLGGISLARRDRDEAYTPADEVFLLELAQRAAVVIDDSRLLLAERTARSISELELADRIEAAASLEHARRRLEALYELSKLFASFENVEQTFAPALDIAAKTLPLRSAILIETDEVRPKMIVWPAEGQDGEHLGAVKEHAEAACSYLVADAYRGRVAAPPWAAATEGDLAKRLIVIPMVVAHQPPFGALQLEGVGPFDRTDLMFVNAMANQLAIALDRDRAWRRDIARREVAELGRTSAEAAGATSERERIVAETLGEKYQALAAENARLYAEAQQAVRVREQVLAIVSHDLKNPLGAILMTTDGLSRRGVLEERRHGFARAVGRIQRSAERMLRLIGDLLDFASIEAGRLAMRRQPQDPASIVRETLATFEGVAVDKDQQLTAEVEPNLPKVHCDRDRILQVLSNLVGNATKATPESGHITLRAESLGHEILFVVSDDGPGIDAEDLAHLFERYWRSDDVQYTGTGLGLSIASGIVAAHGGRLWAESELGHGATFRFTVPVADVTSLFTVPEPGTAPSTKET